METLNLELILTSIAFPGLIVTGIWLRRKGRPYNTILFTAHKLITIGIIILLWLTFRKIGNLHAGTEKGLIMALISGILFLVSFVSGAMQSFEKQSPWFIGIIHKIIPYFLIVSLIITFNILLK